MGKAVRKKLIMAVGSGKGGVGKTMITTALARRLSARGENVVVVDADIAGPNLRASLGHLDCTNTLSDFFSGRRSLASASEAVASEQFQVICGSEVFPDFENNDWRGEKLLRQIRRLDARYIILDLGPGVAPFTLSCFLSADIGILVITPDPLAIQSCFDFVQACLVQGLHDCSQRNPEVRTLLRFLEKRTRNASVPLKTFLQGFNNGRHRIATVLDKLKEDLRAGIVVNLVEEEKDLKVSRTMKALLLDLLDLDVELWGHIRFNRAFRSTMRGGPPEQGQHNDGFDGCLDNLVSVIRLTGFSLGKDTKNGSGGNGETRPVNGNGGNGRSEDVICSTLCDLWDECRLRRGGYPCRMRALGSLKSLKSGQITTDVSEECALT